jgi:hypothetical protein
LRRLEARGIEALAVKFFQPPLRHLVFVVAFVDQGLVQVRKEHLFRSYSSCSSGSTSFGTAHAYRFRRVARRR